MNERRGTSWLTIIGIGCGVLLLGGLCIGGGCALLGGGIFAATSAPADTTKGFFADLRARNHAGALGRMSGTYRQTHPISTFTQAVAAHPALSTQTDDTISNRSVSMGTATMSGHLTTPQGNVPVTATLSSAGGAWYIDSLVIAGVPLQ